MKRGFKTNAEKISIELRKSIGLKCHDRMDCIQILSQLANFMIKEFNAVAIEISEMSKYGLAPNLIETLCNTRGNEVSAVLLRKDKDYIIIYNQSHSSNRINSSIAHEISHILCEHNFNILSLNQSNCLIRELPKEFEDEADWLSSCILVPREGLLWAIRRGMSHDEIASHFGVSAQMVRWRVNTTGVTFQAKNKLTKTS